MTAEIIDGKTIAGIIKKQVVEDIKYLSSYDGVIPRVATLMAGENPESKLYMNLRKKACHTVGIDTVESMLNKDIYEKDFLNIVKKYNADGNIQGILIQLPLPSQISFNTVFETLNPLKDVEGLTPYNMGKTLLGDEAIVPCTPLAVLKILDYINIDLEGKHVVIVNHSVIVGKPLSILALNRNATVTICHVFTDSLEKYTKHADVLITAAGVPNLITKDHVKSGSVVIDVSIVKTDDGISGDVSYDDVKEIAGWITPVPGGVGPVTVACALENVVKTVKYMRKEIV
jgi:methylenetetrahydrofolate dehydrogenase (NADP+) / methenyltetrahydrofolate cyclohydrolase